MEYRRNTHDISKVKKNRHQTFEFSYKKFNYIIKADNNSKEVNLPGGFRF